MTVCCLICHQLVGELATLQAGENPKHRIREISAELIWVRGTVKRLRAKTYISRLPLVLFVFVSDSVSSFYSTTTKHSSPKEIA